MRADSRCKVDSLPHSPSAMGTLRVATLNVGTIVGHMTDIMELATRHNLDVLYVQERRLTHEGLLAAQRAARMAGWTFQTNSFAKDALGRAFGGVGVLSRWPVQVCKLPLLLGEDGKQDPAIQNLTTGRLLWTRVHRNKTRSAVIAAVHLDPADGSRATSLGAAVLRTLAATGEDGMVIGDFNRTRFQSPAAEVLAAGTYRAADAVVAMDTIQSTRSDTPGGRYIDYGLCTPSFSIKGREQHKGIEGHHDLIIYECPWSRGEPVYKRRKAQSTSVAEPVTSGVWQEIWEEHASNFQ